jgi:rubredoxin
MGTMLHSATEGFMFKCTVCGYIHEGTEAPENCPKCNAPKDKFEKLTDEAAGLVGKSRLTNDLHMHLLAILQEAEAIAGDGIEDALDPSCVAIFKRTQKQASEIISSIKAELAGHVSKGKWG